MMIHDRLAIEVEFVECLANPAYLNCKNCAIIEVNFFYFLSASFG